MLLIAKVIVAAAGLYLLTLGLMAAIQPIRAKRFLEAHASSLRAHVLELALRLLVGVVLIHVAPRMRGADFVMVGGWLLVATTLVLGLVPWRLHQRFAASTVPKATRSMPLVSVGALAGGAAILKALTLGPHA